MEGTEFISKPGKTVPLQWEKDVKGEFAVELEVDVINQRVSESLEEIGQSVPLGMNAAAPARANGKRKSS